MNIQIIEFFDGRGKSIAETLRVIDPSIQSKIVKLWHNEGIQKDRVRVHAIILSGGPMGVYELDEYPYIKSAIPYIEKMIKKHTPILGICFGHQLVAHILGGKVIRDEQNAEKEWSEVEQIGASQLFENIPERMLVFQYHNDRIKTVPSGARITAESDRCPIQALEYIGQPVFTVQFHPEIDQASGDMIYGVKSNLGVSPGDIDKNRYQFFSNFIRIVKEESWKTTP